MRAGSCDLPIMLPF